MLWVNVTKYYCSSWAEIFANMFRKTSDITVRDTDRNHRNYVPAQKYFSNTCCCTLLSDVQREITEFFRTVE